MTREWVYEYVSMWVKWKYIRPSRATYRRYVSRVTIAFCEKCSLIHIAYKTRCGCMCVCYLNMNWCVSVWVDDACKVHICMRLNLVMYLLSVKGHFWVCWCWVYTHFTYKIWRHLLFAVCDHLRLVYTECLHHSLYPFSAFSALTGMQNLTIYWWSTYA